MPSRKTIYNGTNTRAINKHSAVSTRADTLQAVSAPEAPSVLHTPTRGCLSFRPCELKSWELEFPE